jgi:hypothetical protein
MPLRDFFSEGKVFFLLTTPLMGDPVVFSFKNFINLYPSQFHRITLLGRAPCTELHSPIPCALHPGPCTLPSLNPVANNPFLSNVKT